MVSDIYQRKRDHIELCHRGDVHPGRHHGLFEELQLIPDAMPELAMDELSLTTQLLGRPLGAPLMVTGMTGGPPEAREINRQLAVLCARYGLPLGVGSQRVITKAPESLASFQVRDVAPDLFLFGNIGVNQLRSLGVERVVELVKAMEADAIAVHLNPAMELVQPGSDADSDFRGGYAAIEALLAALDGRVLVKECGCGISPQVLKRLISIGVPAVDLSGSGGTSWVRVEALRAEGAEAALGFLYDDWGIPTAAATGLAAPVAALHRLAPHHPGEALGTPAEEGSGARCTLIASGGVGDGLRAAKALALGADLVGVARPLLQALLSDGPEGAEAFLQSYLRGLRMAMILTGAQRPHALRMVPRVLGPQLQSWLQQGALGRAEPPVERGEAR